MKRLSKFNKQSIAAILLVIIFTISVLFIRDDSGDISTFPLIFILDSILGLMFWIIAMTIHILNSFSYGYKVHIIDDKITLYYNTIIPYHWKKMHYHISSKAKVDAAIERHKLELKEYRDNLMNAPKSIETKYYDVRR